MRSSALLLLALLALPALGEEAKPDRVGLAADLEPILERLGGAPGEVLPLVEIEGWLRRAGAEARPLLEAAHPSGTERRELGRKRALERLDAGERAAQAAATATGEALKARDLLRGIVEGGRDGSVESAADLARWVGREPTKVKGLLEPYCNHFNPDIAAIAGKLVASARTLEPWMPVLRAFETLQVPSIESATRVALGVPRERFPKIAVANSDGRLHGWHFRGSGLILLDDGTRIDVEKGCKKSEFNSELASYAYDASRTHCPDGESGFWRACLFARWALDLGRIDDAIPCLEAAKAIALKAWPRDGENQFAEHLLRTGADALLSQAAIPRLPDSEGEVLWPRLAALPFDDCRRVASREMERLKRIEEGAVWWSKQGVKHAEDLPAANRAIYWKWRLLIRSSSEHLDRGSMTDFLEDIEKGEWGFSGDMSDLIVLGWDSVPVLLPAIGDDTPTAQWIGDRRLTMDDAARFVLSRILGPVVPLRWDPSIGGWQDLKEPADVTRSKAEAFWKRLEPLDGRARTVEVWHAMGSPANSWALRRLPDLALEDAWKALSPESESRRRAMEIKRLVTDLSAAPRDRVEALLGKTEGELQDVVQQAIDRK